MKKRKWVLIRNPKIYDIRCKLCDGINIEWSEYEDMIWCYDCEKDNYGTPNGLNGPVPIWVARVLGCNPDEMILKTKKIKIPEQRKHLTISEYNEFLKRGLGE